MTENRGNQVSRANDDHVDFKVGIKEIDTAIFYYFNEKETPQPHALTNSLSGLNINLFSNIPLLKSS